MFELLQQIFQTGQVVSPTLALLSAFALGIAFGAVPTGTAEAFALAAGVVNPWVLRIPLLILYTLGHVLGKLLWYWLGTHSERIPNARVQDLRARAQQLLLQYRHVGNGLIFTSAFASLPPFLPMVVAAGVTRVPILQFLIISFVGRLLRFAAVAAFPALIHAVY
ncbi:MAG: VTT domain-containing protein [Gemmatimonadaceae bacterium]|nr:VTT domain-containing protein [Gemmatimonadaceae bacterium]